MDTSVLIISIVSVIFLILLIGIRCCCIRRYRITTLARLHKEAETKRLAAIREADDIFDMSDDDEEEVELVRRVTPNRLNRREASALEADASVDTTLMATP